jgi:hypothetical protein
VDLLSTTSKHRRELAYEIAKLRGLQRSADPALDDADGKALALQIREQAEVCLQKLDLYQSSVPGRMWFDAQRRCQPLREDLRRTGLEFRTASGEMALRSGEQLWGRSWLSPTEPSQATDEIVDRHAGADTEQLFADSEGWKTDPDVGTIGPIEVVLSGLEFDPDPQLLEADPAQMMTLVTILVGTPEEAIGDLFYATLCTPEWIAAQSENGSFMPGAGLLVVKSEDFDERPLRREIERFLVGIHEETWGDVAKRIKEWFPFWEFDGCAP